jgi:hypothetical protein
MTQIFGEIGQPHQDHRQADDVADVDPAVKHAGGDDSKSQTEDGPDDKLLKSGHVPHPFKNESLRCSIVRWPCIVNTQFVQSADRLSRGTDMHRQKSRSVVGIAQILCANTLWRSR